MALEREKDELLTYVKRLALNKHIPDVAVDVQDSDKSNVFVISDNGKLTVTVTTDLLKSNYRIWEPEVQKAFLMATNKGADHFVGKYS